ncbi:GGDEF domain-containing protein [Butyrivibrio sp. NC3005]|uniref:GGDEF domain-containing protein n=1 Tax=Butyrivibrio sp. NC3005 TaxID=1280685 RepID=UPI00040A7358|nr:GGDEF domain-containing protein [Butyrivibrio sp. NC3005]
MDKKRSDFLRGLRRHKLCSILVIFGAAVASFIILFKRQSLRDRIFIDNDLKILCLILYLVLVFGLVYVLADLVLLRSYSQKGYNLQRMAYLDALTGLPNRSSFDMYFRKFDTRKKLSNLGMILMSIDSLALVNTNLGHEKGDELIGFFCEMLMDISEDFGFIGRNGGNEFLLAIEDVTDNKRELFLKKLALRIKDHNILHPDTPMTIRYAFSSGDATNDELYTLLISQTYVAFREKGQLLSL